MLGPLPPLHRAVVFVVALLLLAGVGAWAAFMLHFPALVSVGASIGLAFGALSAYLLLHTSRSAPQPHRVRRHRLH